MNMPLDVSPLFEPLAVKAYTLRNRIVMPPMVANRPIISAEGIAWYSERAAGGVGLVIVEATGVFRFGAKLQADGLHSLVESIHAAGALAAIQLFPGLGPLKSGRARRPSDLDPADIREILSKYGAAAEICDEAGFDGVEPHGAHGYLLNQFFSPADNARTDEFGGSLQNRMRLGLEIVAAVRRALGAEKLVLYRHTPAKKGSYGLDESLQFVEALAAAGVDILDVSPATSKVPADLAAPFRELGVPVIAVGQMDELANSVDALTHQRADLIAVGRGLIADPCWARKVQEGRFDDIVACTRCDETCWETLRQGVPVACSQW